MSVLEPGASGVQVGNEGLAARALRVPEAPTLPAFRPSQSLLQVCPQPCLDSERAREHGFRIFLVPRVRSAAGCFPGCFF